MQKMVWLILVIPILLAAQDAEISQRTSKFSGQLRTYFMATVNKGDLKDFEALATGGQLKYQFYPFKNWEFGAALYNSTNLGLQDLSIADARTGTLSRYEEGLFNRLDIENDMIFLVGELYASYKLQNHTFSLGRIKINTPLINPQDGRMIPTMVQGFWYNHNAKNSNSFQFGILNKIAPRSTAKFYGIGESIGTYPVGRNQKGSENLYAGNTTSDYIIVTHANIRLTENVRLGIWNQFTQNIFNSFVVKPVVKLARGLSVEGEWLHQNKIGDGGNTEEALRYFNQNRADVFGIQLALTNKRDKLSIAYERILPHGQFLSPREWGREGLFSFQKRERSEGSADNSAFVLNYKKELEVFDKKLNLVTLLSVGRHIKPAVTDAILNKYAMPDYTHINFDIFFNIKKLKRLRPELLVTSKIAHGAIPNNPNFYFNKVDLIHIDLILNYNF